MRAGRRLFITGASGTLGGPLSQQAAAAGWDVYAGYLSNPLGVWAGMPVQLDLRDPHRVRATLVPLMPDVIIHAAVTERSGPGYDEAIRLAARSIAETAREVGARLIALSADLVFDGMLPLYDESTLPRPSAGSVYGRAKRDAEQTIAGLYPAALIVRTSLIYDFDPSNAQVAWMLRAIERGEKIPLYTDQIRCPVWVWNLARILLELAEEDLSGILHAVGPRPVSRYDLGCTLLEALGYNPAAHVVPARAPDHLPKRLVLSTQRLESVLRYNKLRSLEEARALWRARDKLAGF